MSSVSSLLFLPFSFLSAFFSSSLFSPLFLLVLFIFFFFFFTVLFSLSFVLLFSFLFFYSVLSLSFLSETWSSAQSLKPGPVVLNYPLCYISERLNHSAELYSDVYLQK